MTTITDLFAGAGGTSTGAASAPGIEVRTAEPQHQAELATQDAFDFEETA